MSALSTYRDPGRVARISGGLALRCIAHQTFSLWGSHGTDMEK